MNFTGSELLKKRNFYSQTGNFGFTVGCTVNSATGRYVFGVSGQDNKVEFVLDSGKLFYEEKFIHSYRPFEEFLLDVSMGANSVNVTKNETPLIYGLPKPTGIYDYFYFGRQGSGINADFSLYISGDNQPNYQIQTVGFLSQSGQEAVTGYFQNLSPYPLRVFDSNMSASANYSFGKLASSIPAYDSGFFAYTGNFETINFSAPILTTFNTSYDNRSVLFTIVDNRTFDSFVFLTNTFNPVFNTNNQLNYNLAYLNYSGDAVTDAFDTEVQFILKYVTGTGVFTGIWDFFTGLDSSSLFSIKTNGNFNTNTISGSGVFAPNSQIATQLIYSGEGSGTDAIQLIITGSKIINPINQTIFR